MLLITGMFLRCFFLNAGCVVYISFFYYLKFVFIINFLLLHFYLYIFLSDIVIEVIKKVTASPPLPANLLTCLRAVTNLFKNTSYYEWLLNHRAEVSNCLLSKMQEGKPNNILNI